MSELTAILYTVGEVVAVVLGILGLLFFAMVGLAMVAMMCGWDGPIDHKSNPVKLWRAVRGNGSFGGGR